MRRWSVAALCALAAGCALDTDAVVGRRAGRCAGGDCDGGLADLGAPAPAVAVAPAQLDFGRVRVGAPYEMTAVVRNEGAAPLQVRSLTVRGSRDFVPVVAGADATRVPAVLADPDRDGEPGLAPGGRFVVLVRFRPSALPAARATLVLSTDDPARPEATVALTGNAGVPCLVATPSPLLFDGTLVGRADTREVRLENCGDEAVEIGDVRLGGDGVFRLENPPPLPFVLAAAEPGEAPPALRLRVAFASPGPGTWRGALLVAPATPKPPPLVVRLVGRAVLNGCPVARVDRDGAEVWAGVPVRLDGSPSTDPDPPTRRPRFYRWAVVERPTTSVAEPVEWFDDPDDPAARALPDDPRTPEAWFRPDVEGVYRLALNVTDELDLDSETCGTSAEVVVRALPPRGLRVELTWTPAGDDLDLHLRHPAGAAWFEAPGDAHADAPRPDWGRAGDPADDPRLDGDDRRGAYGENLYLVEPEEAPGGPYLAGVHRPGDAGPAPLARLRVFFDGLLAWDSAAAGLDRVLRASDHFWEAVEIHWPERRVDVRDVYRHLP